MSEKDFDEFKETYENVIEEVDKLEKDLVEFTGGLISTMENQTELSDYEIKEVVRQTTMRLEAYE